MKKTITSYNVFLNGKRYCMASEKEQAESIKRALIEKENAKQNMKNLFTNISVEIRPVTFEVIA